jgi:uncharacterized protein YxjI
MEIDIHQKKITVGDKYKIFVDGKVMYSASRELFSMLPVINLFTQSGTSKMLSIEKRFTFFKASYDLVFDNNVVLQFRTKSLWRKHFQCSSGPDLFDIYGHKGRKYSVYKNDRQVAWWAKNKVAFFEGDVYKIVAERDKGYELIIAFCLIIDNHFNNPGGNNSITIDLGHIGPEERKFDEAWQPYH